MTRYEEYKTIIQSSLDELREIARYLEVREDVSSPTTVLIGGWAVHSYNPWYGSVDIDIITNARTRNSLKNYLVGHRGFARARNFDDTKRVQKLTPYGKAIILDFGTRERKDPFEGMERHIRYNMLDGRTELRPIGNGLNFPVPKREVLLFFKMKAAWDRNHRIASETTHDLEWEIGKLRKDRADILALLDPAAGGHETDLSFLGEMLREFSFLRDCLERAAGDAEAIGFYGQLKREETEDIIKRILNLTE